MSRTFRQQVVTDSPGSLARRIESCIVRNAVDEECRAQKALYLLKAKDRWIACLEKRVAELESAAVSLHAMSLQGSVTSLSPQDTVSRLSVRRGSNEKSYSDEPSVPALRLLSSSNSDRDAFWSPELRHVCRKESYVGRGCERYSDSSLRSRSVIYEDTPFLARRAEQQRLRQERSPCRKTRGNGESDDGNERCNSPTREKDANAESRRRAKSTHAGKRENSDNGKKVRTILHARQRRSYLPRRRVKLRRRIFELSSKRHPATAEASTMTRPEEEKATKKVEARTEDGVVMALAQEAQVIAAKKSCSTQTKVTLKKECSTMMNVEDDPAPQWLIEEALNRGNEVCQDKERQREMEMRKEAEEYEAVITALERKLEDVKIELQDTLRRKCMAKEKYKRTLETVKEEARRENQALQEKIVKICSSVLEKFGPYALSDRRDPRQVKACKRLKNYGKLSAKLRRNLRKATETGSRLKCENEEVKRALEEMTEKYAATSKCLTRLKQEMQATEINLNDLIAENGSLRKKIDETKEWVEKKVGKEQHDKSNAVQFKVMEKTREVAKLKKKADEDFATIAELRNKLLRSESANANKGFLLNRYKNQLTELAKEKDGLNAKIKSLDAEINSLRNGNSQLKAKITLLSNEKEKLIVENEKPDADMKEKVGSVLIKKYEEALKTVKQENEENLKAMKWRLSRSENNKSEFCLAIKEFLIKIYEHRGVETEKCLSGDEACDREAQETACNILNVTPDQLRDFMGGKSSDTINLWLADFNKITSKSNFANSLTKFLLKKTIKV